MPMRNRISAAAIVLGVALAGVVTSAEAGIFQTPAGGWGIDRPAPEPAPSPGPRGGRIGGAAGG
jgi:hypothetical protein